MAKQRYKKKGQRQRGDGTYAHKGNTSYGRRDPRTPFSYTHPYPHIPRSHRNQNLSPRRNYTSHQSRPVSNHSNHHNNNTHSNPRINTARPSPFPNQPSQQDPPSSPSPSRSSILCTRCNSPHLTHVHRDLKNQGKALLAGLERLISALEALEPDPAEMEWVRDADPVVLMPGCFRGGARTASGGGGGGGGRRMEEEEEGRVRGACEQSGGGVGPEADGKVEAEARGATAMPDPAGGTSAPPGVEERQIPGLNGRGPYCPNSCFYEALWNKTPEEGDGGGNQG